MKIDIQEIGFDKDHVHIIVDIGLYSIVEVAKKLKGVSGYKLLRAFK
jgi:REP element-mobilizing transposase RayT